MRLEEMGVIGRQAKIADTAPSHAGEVGRILTATTERAYVQFANGDKEWFSNKHIVGTRKTESFDDFAEYPLTEMAAKKQCDKCGKTMAANHYWYKGGWKCKKAKPEGESSDAAKPAKKETAHKPAKEEDKFPHMDDKDYDKLDAKGKADQDAKEQAYYKRHGRTGPQDYKPKDANEEAAFKRAVAFADEMRKRAAAKEKAKK